MTRTKDMRWMHQGIRWALAIAVAVGMLLMLPGTALATGDYGKKKECPTELLAKYEVQGGDFVFEKGEDVIAFVKVKTDDEGEVVGFVWDSDADVESVLVKAGYGTKEYPGDQKKIYSHKGISNVQFCAPEPDEEEPSEEPSEEEPSEEPSEEEPSEEPSEEEPSEEPTDEEPADDDDDDDDAVGGIRVPTRIDTGAGGSSGPSLPSVLTLLTLAGASFAGVTARLIRGRA